MHACMYVGLLQGFIEGSQGWGSFWRNSLPGQRHARFCGVPVSFTRGEAPELASFLHLILSENPIWLKLGNVVGYIRCLP